MERFDSFKNLNFQLLFKTRKNLVMAVAFGAVGILLLFLAYQQTTQLFATRAALVTEQRRVTQLNQKAQELEQLRLSPEFAQAEQMNRILPSRKPLLELLNNLNSVAGETRVSITEFEINPGEIATDSTQVAAGATGSRASTRRAAADYDRLDLKLTIVGELVQIRRFMDLIEQVSPITTITNLTVDRKVGSVGGTQTTTRADLSLSTYYYTKPISATLSAALPAISAREREIFQEILSFTPAELEAQTEIIGGSNQDLFGITGLNVSDLETQLGEEE